MELSYQVFLETGVSNYLVVHVIECVLCVQIQTHKEQAGYKYNYARLTLN